MLTFSDRSSVIDQPTLILASSSYYRRKLLTRLGILFNVVIPAIDESPLFNEAPEATAMRLAETKARTVAAAQPNNANRVLIIGSDQIAAFDSHQIGKPGTHEQALAQLRAIRGRDVHFHSALCLFDSASGKVQTVNVVTHARFRNLPDTLLETYLYTEKPYDVTSGAKSEGLGIVLFEAIESDDPTALIGLPLIALTDMLLAVGYPLLKQP